MAFLGRLFERHIQRTATVQLAQAADHRRRARDHCIRFRSRIDQPRHMVKLVNFRTLAPYARVYTVEKHGTWKHGRIINAISAGKTTLRISDVQ
jgi:hypothetical protein